MKTLERFLKIGHMNKNYHIDELVDVKVVVSPNESFRIE
jgi:hypothetical protein